MFDKMRTEGRYNEELAYYFQTNVVPRRGRSPSILITAMRCIAAMRILTVHDRKKDPDELQDSRICLL